MKTWFTADPHYFHKNITLGESSWPNKDMNCRNFPTTQEMSRHIVKQLNKYVEENDTLYCLGDWSFSGVNNIWNFRKQLCCKNIHLVLGNHDSNIKNNRILPNCEIYRDSDIAAPVYIDAGSYSYDFAKAQEIFSSVSEYLEITLDGITVCMMHYPLEEWNHSHGKTKSYMLHGHQHGKNNIISNRLDVGIDNAYKLFGEYRPFSWKDIKSILK